MIRAIFVLFSCVVSRTRNCPVSKYSRYRIGLPSVLRRRLRAPEDSSSVSRTTDHHTVRMRESPRDPRNLIRSRTPVRNPSASSHTTIIPRRNILTGSDLKVFPPRSRCASDGSSPFSTRRSTIKSRDALAIHQSRIVVISTYGRGDHALCGGDTHPHLHAKSSHTSKNTCVHARSSRCRITVSSNLFVFYENHFKYLNFA